METDSADRADRQCGQSGQPIALQLSSARRCLSQFEATLDWTQPVLNTHSSCHTKQLTCIVVVTDCLLQPPLSLLPATFPSLACSPLSTDCKMQFSKMALKTSFALKGLDRVDGEAEAEAKVGTEAAVGAAVGAEVGAAVGVGIGVEDEARAEAGNWFLLSVNSKLSALHLSIRCDPQLSSFCPSLLPSSVSPILSLFLYLLNSVFFSLPLCFPLFLPSLAKQFRFAFNNISFRFRLCLSIVLSVSRSILGSVFLPPLHLFLPLLSLLFPSSSSYLSPSSPPSSSCPAFLITPVLLFLFLLPLN